MTTGLSDKQLQDAFTRPGNTIYKGLRAVADLAITTAEAEIHALREELEDARARLELAETEENFLE